MFAGSYFDKGYYSGEYFSPVTLLIFVPKEGDEGSGGRVVSTTKKVNAELLAQIQREDEELLAIVTIMSKILL
jgi:hypothetical protein